MWTQSKYHSKKHINRAKFKAFICIQVSMVRVRNHFWYPILVPYKVRAFMNRTHVSGTGNNSGTRYAYWKCGLCSNDLVYFLLELNIMFSVSNQSLVVSIEIKKKECEHDPNLTLIHINLQDEWIVFKLFFYISYWSLTLCFLFLINHW